LGVHSGVHGFCSGVHSGVGDGLGWGLGCSGAGAGAPSPSTCQVMGTDCRRDGHNQRLFATAGDDQKCDSLTPAS
jgi:hypothetical protein